MHLIFGICVLVHFDCISAGAGFYQLNVVGKDTQQSSTQHNGVSSLAVDGDSNSDFFHGSCTHTDLNPHGAWWAVDLGTQYKVHSVGLVNRRLVAYRLNKFTIYGDDVTFDPEESIDKKTCSTFDGVFGTGETKIFNCTSLMNSRFIEIRLNHYEKLTLCEVYVYVACNDGNYGEDCQEDCSENCKQQPCDRVTGACPDGGCKAGYTGVMCEQACDNGKYGEDCQEDCSENCIKQPCNRVTGACPDGECKAGYTGDMCEQECPQGTYGEGCDGKCSEHCHDFQCDKKTGFCDCSPGYMGSKCDLKCSMGTFGDRCMYNCSERCKYQCDSTSESGTCFGGCMAGYKGETCDTECDPGEYGENCVLNCSENCKWLPCDKFTGVCPKGMCTAGFKGEKCITECDSAKYGENCAFTCSKNCKEQTCNSNNGYCAEEESNASCNQNTPVTGIPVVTLAVAVAVLSVLCIGQTIFIIISKVKALRSRKNGLNKNQDTINIGGTYENAVIAAGEGNSWESNQSQKTDDIALNVSSAETYERINNSVRYTNDDQGQTYEKLTI